MPNHFHEIILFREENRLSDYMRDLKKYTSNLIRDEIYTMEPEELNKIQFIRGKQVFKVWNDRFDDKVIFSTKFLQQKLNYIHNNPLQEKWKLAENPEDYKYSSAKFYLTGEPGVIPVVHYTQYFSPPIG